jgi:predicted esterase
MCALPAAAFAADPASRNAHCKEGLERYVLFAPPQPAPSPAILLLHGAGGQPEPMIEAWLKLARKENLVLIAPVLPRVAKFEEIAPSVFRCVVEDAKQAAAIDPSRIYLFGHSMGGYLAYDAALLDSTYYAAATIHAMGIDKDYVGIVNRAQRKIPIAIYIGEDDQLVSLDDVRHSRNLLQKSGFPIHYVELPRHDHNYFAQSDEVNADAWSFMKPYALPPPTK